MGGNQRSFTLMEIMMVVILVGIIAAFGVPRYTQSQARVNEREAVHSLRLIGEALERYQFRHGAYPAFNMPQVSDINTALELGIVEQNMDYDCAAAAGDVVCSAVSAGGWEINYDTSRTPTANPQCAVANCPSIDVGVTYYGMF